jgi:hypothetical protein
MNLERDNWLRRRLAVWWWIDEHIPPHLFLSALLFVVLVLDILYVFLH